MDPQVLQSLFGPNWQQRVKTAPNGTLEAGGWVLMPNIDYQVDNDTGATYGTGQVKSYTLFNSADGGKINHQFAPDGSYMGDYKGNESFGIKDLARGAAIVGAGMLTGGALSGLAAGTGALSGIQSTFGFGGGAAPSISTAAYEAPTAVAGYSTGLDGAAAAGAGGFAGDATAAGYAGLDAAGAETLGGGALAGGAGGIDLGGGLFMGADGSITGATAGAASGLSNSELTAALAGGGSLAGSGGSGFNWSNLAGLAGPVLNGVGGYLSNKAASGAAQQAADGAKFRPVGVTSRFGGSNFQYDANGNLVGAGYTVSPDIAALRDRMIAGAGQDMSTADTLSGAAQSLFGLGNKYISGNPAQDWMQRQQTLLAPSREQQLAKIRDRLVATGRTGLATDGTSTMAASNPELQAYYNSLQQQDNQLAANAEEQGRQSVNFGAGLFTTGNNLLSQRYNPVMSSINNANTLEGLGQDTLNMGAQLGGRAAQAGSQAAPWMYKANATSPTGAFLSGVGSNPGFWTGASNAFDKIQGLWTS